MQNKLAPAIIRDKQLTIRLAIIIIIIFSAKVLFKKQKVLVAQLEKIKAEKQLVVQIPAFKKEIAILEKLSEEQSVVVLKDEKKEPALKGIMIADNVNYAIIDDMYYREGDNCGDYIIFKINLDSVILQDKETKGQKTIYLPNK